MPEVLRQIYTKLMTTGYQQELHLKFDIITVSKTWAELDVIDDLNLIDYSAYHVTRETRKGGGVIVMKTTEHILSDVKALKTIFLCGDLNIDKPTRITVISATLTNNIFTNEL